ncbi:hypothetical protein BO71DRAFT_401924 [Aspergillus ellipticus CBS 707.79]|uniref:Uncharacterized protein n=1 Tax=Aspergillus ellipticus CBS 707.79 TaxID=1448320 RepID=A0A319CZV8_9EURO|nr:hypothetical protein BO71DRAFT_401924 [Aspergillus ellipticus CBS 707.79]
MPQLLDMENARPTAGTRHYERWKLISARVANWIMLQVDKTFLDRHRLHQNPKEYADETFDCIRKAVDREGVLRKRTEILKLMTMSRRDYDQATQYVRAFEEAVILTDRLGCGITPYTAAVVLLHNLRLEPGYWAAAMALEVGYDEGDTYSMSDFCRLCDDVCVLNHTDN